MVMDRIDAQVGREWAQEDAQERREKIAAAGPLLTGKDEASVRETLTGECRLDAGTVSKALTAFNTAAAEDNKLEVGDVAAVLGKFIGNKTFVARVAKEMTPVLQHATEEREKLIKAQPPGPPKR